MADNAYDALLGAWSDSGLVDTLTQRSVYVLDSSENTQTIDLRSFRVISRSGNFYFYDSEDTTSAHDGTAVLVDENGRRYKIGELGPVASVLDRTGTPPGDPEDNDAYLVTEGGAGAWAGWDDSIAIYLGQWREIPPAVGWALYVEDEDAYYHYTAAGDWEQGLGALVLTEDAVTPVEDQFWGGLSVEAVVNDPPGSPTNKMAWIVGTSPTGDFVTHNGEVAYRRSGEWKFRGPYEGAKVWDKATDQVLTFDGSAWQEPPDAQILDVSVVDLVGLSNYDILDLHDFDTVELEVIDSGILVNVRLSTDNGTNFISTASAYYNMVTDTAVAQVAMAGDTGASSRSIHAIKISGLNKVNTKTTFTGGASFFYRDTIEAHNAIRVLRPSGTFPSGTRLHIKKYLG